MKHTIEEMRAEACKRMKALGLYDVIIKEFEEKGLLYYSERTPLGGILYWMHNNPEWLEKVKTFENEYNCVVYHATHEYTEFGECLSLLYVSADDELWDTDMDDVTNACEDGNKYILAYVINLNDDLCSERGTIGVQEKAGGLIRTA